MITLFPDEKIITNSDGNKVILTTHRICYEYKEWGRSYNQSIMLEHITSCENHSYQKNLLLIIAGFTLSFGVYRITQGDSATFGVFVLLTLAFLWLFWITRQNLIIIGSPSTKMQIKISGMKREVVLSFINNIEQTKHKRVLAMNTKTS